MLSARPFASSGRQFLQWPSVTATLLTIHVYNPVTSINKLLNEGIKRYKTTPDLIVEALRKAILRGEYKAGQNLRQEELADRFGVSRIPVREAMRQLEAEGFITIYPNRGAIVTELSALEAQELYEIRLALESTALRLAIPKITTEALRLTEDILDKTDRETEANNLGELNWEFHAALYLPACRPRLFGMMHNLHLSVDRYMRFKYTALDYRNKSQTEHHRLLAACREKKIEEAVGLLSEHTEAAGKVLVAYLEQEKLTSEGGIA